MANIQDILFVFVQGFSGAVAGYITNKYAVNMIFKEYTPLKIGGAVKKNKEKFIEEVSELVEKDIINANTLTGSIKSDDFAKVVDAACVDFIKNSLKEAFKDTKLREVPEIKKSAEQSVAFVEQNIQEELPKLIDNFSNKIELNAVLDDKQLDNICQKVVAIILDVLESDEKLEEFLLCLYDENKNITLSDILSHNAKIQLQTQIVSVINESINEIIDSEDKCIELLNKIYDLLDFKEIISNLKFKLGQKTVEEVIGQEGLDSVSELLFKYINELIYDSDNKDKINDIISELIDTARGVELTLFEILPPEMASNFIMYIKNIIPKIAPQIFNWLYENKDNIDNMINTAAMETSENIEDPALKGLIGRFEGILPTLSQTLKVVDRASDMVMEYELTEEDASKIYVWVVDFLKKTSLGDLIDFVKDKLYMTNDDICEKFIELFEANGSSMTKNLVYSFKDKSISKIVDLDLEKLFKFNVMPLIYKFIKSKKDAINSYIDKFVASKAEDILSNDLEKLVGRPKVGELSKKLPKWLAGYIVNNREICKKYLKDIIKKILNNVDLEKLILENKEDIILVICSKFNSIKKLIFDALKNKEVNDVFSFIRDEQKFGGFLSEKINKAIQENTDKIFKNNVKTIIQKNLEKLNEDEIGDIAQSFMGKQLKPLSYFGALLGAIVGVIFGFAINGTVDSFGFYNGYVNTIIACVLMGLVGIFTNIIALWMIFHPYKKNKFVDKIPLFRIFAQGYIPAHKNSFATGMAYFIDNELLKGKRIESLFDSNRDTITKYLFNLIAKNNFKLLVDVAKQKKNEISKFLCDLFINVCMKNKAKIAKYASDVVVNLEMEDILSKNTTIEKSKEVLLNLDKFNDKLIEFAQARIDNQKTINEILPENISRAINDDIDKFINNSLKNTVESMLKEEFIKELIIKNKDFYVSMTDKSICEFVGDKNIDKLKNIANKNLNNYILTKLPTLIDSSLEEFMQKNLSEDMTISEIFDGKIKVMLDKRLYSITSSLLKKLYKFISDNEEEAVNLVIKIVKGQLNFLIKLAYEFANGDALVRMLVQNIIETKLERLLDESMYSTTKAISIALNSTIYPSSLGDIGLNVEDINTSLVANTLVKDIKQNESLLDKVDEIAIIAIDELKYKKVSEIVKNTNIEDLDGVYNLLNDEISFVIDKLNENYINNIDKVNSFVSLYVYENITAKLFNKELNEVVDLDNVLDTIFTFGLDKLNNSEQSRNMILNAIANVYDKSIASMTVGELLLEDDLTNSLDKHLDKLFKNIDFNENNQYICEKIIFNFIESEFRFVEAQTKEYVIKNMMEALLSTAVEHTAEAIEALNLKEITSEQVDLMDAREIHMLFKAFAGDFFIKLYIYGSVGLVFGLNIYLSILLGILDLIYSKKIENIEISSKNIFKE